MVDHMVFQERLRIILLVIWGTALSLSAQAQKNYNGVVFTNEGDTVKGMLAIGSAAMCAVQVQFTDYENRQEVPLRPFDIVGYRYADQVYKSKIYKASPDAEKGKMVFMQEVEAGALSLYRFYNNDRRRYEWLLQDEDEVMHRVPGRWAFHGFMRERVERHRQLAGRINRWRYGRKDIAQIVAQYNAWMAQKG